LGEEQRTHERGKERVGLQEENLYQNLVLRDAYRRRKEDRAKRVEAGTFKMPKEEEGTLKGGKN